MISLVQLKHDLQIALNSADWGLYVPSEPNEEYSFNIVFDAGEYQRSIREGNRVHRIINGVMSLTNDDKTGISDDSINAVISATFEFVIPDNGKRYPIFDGNEIVGESSIPEGVRALVDNVLATSNQKYMNDEQGNVYLVTSKYTFANTGAKDTRYQVGDSITYTVFIDYAIIAAGVSSASIEVYIDDSRIYPTRIDISRQSVQEGVIPSNSISAKTATQSTQLTIGITKPIRFDAFDTAAIAYILTPEIASAISVRIKFPKSLTDGAIEYIEKTYNLSFANAAVAGELNLAVPLSATLNEEVSI